MKKEAIATGICSVCGRALSGGIPCRGGFKIETEANKAKAATDDGFALQCRNVADGNKESIAETSVVEQSADAEQDSGKDRAGDAERERRMDIDDFDRYASDNVLEWPSN